MRVKTHYASWIIHSKKAFRLQGTVKHETHFFIITKVVKYHTVDNRYGFTYRFFVRLLRNVSFWQLFFDRKSLWRRARATLVRSAREQALLTRLACLVNIPAALSGGPVRHVLKHVIDNLLFDNRQITSLKSLPCVNFEGRNHGAGKL